MKKLMTATIIVVPLILLAIMLVSGAIMSLVTHIYVESVEFVKSDDLILIMSDESAPPQYDISNELTILPLKATNRDLSFTTDDESLVKVNEDGILTAVYYGETYLTIQSYENKAAVAKRKIIVTDKSVHALKMVEGYKTELYEGQSQVMSVSVLPKEAENKLIKWISSDESILHVGANGTVTAVGAGTATVTAISDDNEEVTASATITCYKKLNDIDFDSALVVTALKETDFPQITPIPSDAYATYTFATDNANVATVDGNGKITFLKEGHVKVIVTATDFAGKTVTKAKEYTSTDGYFLPPLFKIKDYSVDYDDYKDKVLPIEFAKAPVGSYRDVTEVKYSIDGVLEFNENDLSFTFKSEMPVGAKYIDVTVYASVYDTKTGSLNEKYEDMFRLNVSRDAKNLEFSYKGDKTESVQTSQDTLTLTSSKESGSSVINVIITPENHTGTVVYELTGGSEYAKLNGSVLTFNETSDDNARTAEITVKIFAEGNKLLIEKKLSVTYTPIQPGEKEVEVKQEVHETTVSLNMLSDEKKDTGVITFSAPTGATLKYETNDTTVIKLEKGDGEDGKEGYKITPLKGGFATITITAVYNSASLVREGDNNTWTIEVYVDRPVSKDDFTVTINNENWGENQAFRTSKSNFNYSVTVSDDNGSTEGKELFVKVGDKAAEKAEGLAKSGKVDFNSLASLDVTFEMRYSDNVPTETKKDGVGEKTIVRSVTTSNGALDQDPTVYYDNGSRKNLSTSGNNELTINNIGETLVLNVEENFQPTDFDIATHKPIIESTGYVGATVSDDGKTITLTGLNKTDSGNDSEMSLTIGGKTFTLRVTVCSLADQIEVTCGEEKIDKEKEYKTLLNKLTFTVKLSRSDDKPINDKALQYSFDDSTWHETVYKDNKTTIEFGEKLVDHLYIRAKDNDAAKIDIKLQKSHLDDFGLKITYKDAQGKEQTLDTIEKVADKPSVSYILPTNMQSTITLALQFNESDFLGGVGDSTEFEELFRTTIDELTKENVGNWTTSYDSHTKSITLTFKETDKSFNKKVELKHDEITLDIYFMRVSIGKLEFVGFDSTNTTDVHRGYQQVRVFAKHSYYKVGDSATGAEVNHALVDYFKMPYKALVGVEESSGDVPAGSVTWKLYKVVGDTPTLLVEQKGDTVTYYEGDGKAVYVITKNADTDKEYTLKLKTTNPETDEEEIVDTDENIPWIDVFSESGVARIHFGNFNGLSESDIQNDYFGNFDDSDNYQQVPEHENDYDGSGRTFKASSGAYSFLKVEASDGSETGTKRHFNFNVLNDNGTEEENQIVNVFDATGYYAHQKVVLQTNLYGPGELDGGGNTETEATQKDLILDKTPQWDTQDKTQLGKTLIFGNGYQVNLEVRNDLLIKNMKEVHNNSQNTSTVFGSLYNVMIKGCNPVTEITNANVKQYLTLNGAYYTDIQYYTKIISGKKVNKEGDDVPHNVIFFKNTVLRDCSAQALLLWATNNTQTHVYEKYDAYFENVVESNCMLGICSMGTGTNNRCYIRGFLDALNYSNVDDLGTKADQMSNGLVSKDLIPYVASEKAKFLMEWFGKKKDLVKDGEDQYKDWYFNPVVVGLAMGTGMLRPYWNEAENKYTSPTFSTDPTRVGGNETLKRAIQDMMADVYVYNCYNNVDSGVSNTKHSGENRDMSKLFTSERYIRLLCQYLDVDEKGKPIQNTDHIMWHMQKVYRDLSLIENRKEDHIEALKESIQKAIEDKRWDGEWADGSNVEEALKDTEPKPENIFTMFGNAILPERKENY